MTSGNRCKRQAWLQKSIPVPLESGGSCDGQQQRATLSQVVCGHERLIGRKEGAAKGAAAMAHEGRNVGGGCGQWWVAMLRQNFRT